MASDPTASESSGTAEWLPRPRTSVVTLVFTDMVDSMALQQRLGDRASAALFQKHHKLPREALSRLASGREIETAGHSFLLVFATPSNTVQFSLPLPVRLREMAPAGRLRTVEILETGYARSRQTPFRAATSSDGQRR